MGARDEKEARAVLTAAWRRKIGIAMVRAHATLKNAQLARLQSRSNSVAADRLRARQLREDRQRMLDYCNHYCPALMGGEQWRQLARDDV